MNTIEKAAAAEGLDPAFAAGGILELPFEGIVGQYPDSVAALPDRKMLVLFSASPSENSPAKVARLLENGTLDSSFGKQGIVEIPVRAGVVFSARHLRLLDNGGWLVTGTVKHPNDTVDLAVIRQLHDGQMDTSFGPQKDGMVTVNVYDLIGSRSYPDANFLTRRHDEKNAEKSSAGGVGVAAVGLQDGKVVLSSTVFFAFNYLRGLVIRFEKDGSLDKTFNQKGFVQVELPGIDHAWNYAYGLAVEPGGNVLVCGDFSRASDDEWPDAYVIRYDQYGNVDASYGSNQNGVVTITDGSRWLDLVSMALQPDGGVFAVGTADLDRRRDGLIVALNSSGSFNLVFNNGKPLFSRFTEHGVSWERCILQTDGKLVVSGQGGSAFIDENSSVTTARYNPNGSLDTTFVDKGWTIFNHESGIDLFTGCTVTADNRTVICGYTSFDTPPLPGYVLRYLA
jgi:uncharacterized delta-60 repeat protein